MPTDPTETAALDDNPITLTEIHQFSAPNQLLARKLADHLSGEWTIGHDSGSVRALLTGPRGEAFVTYVTDRRGFWEAVIRGRRPDDLPDEYGWFNWNGIDLPIETAPSEIVRQLEADVLPSYRAVLTKVHAEIEQHRTDTARLRERADVLAARLGPDWRVKEHRDLLQQIPRSYFTVSRNVQNKQIFGEFAIRQGQPGTAVNLRNVTTDTLDTIVNTVVRHQENDPNRWLRWPKRLKKALLLMHHAGYSIDRIGTIHKHLFGEYIFKMDSHVGVGYPVIAYLRERPNMVEQVIKLLDPEPKGK